MKLKPRTENPRENLAYANARVKLLEELRQGTALIKRTRGSFPDGTDERRFLKLVTDALFYVSVRQLDGFYDFLAEMEAIDSDEGHKKIQRGSKDGSEGNKTGKSNAKRARP